ncbi:MAG: GNAT family N-acetyltransferase [Oscillospiraceae bacterium]|jgi:ribosomal protein S18 acetylase RimI-like enzyme|nr:GNAT family N-acetyltransferase [Oscillospiraceae bacterium]
MKIRAAAEGDREALLAMTGRMYAEHAGFPFTFDPAAARSVLATQLTSKLCAMFIAEDGGGVFGFCSAQLKMPDRRFTMDGRLGRIADIYVEPDARKGGVARALLRAAEDWLREHGATLIECDVMGNNAAGNAFWSKMGYGELAVLRSKKIL